MHFFGAVSKCCVYDNLSSVVKRRRGTDITLNETFQHFAGYYCFRVHPCWPGAANQKGAVERPIDYVKQNFWAGRYFADFDDLVLGHTENPGNPGHDGWYLQNAGPGAYGEIQDVIANDGRALHEFAPAAAGNGMQTIDRRLLLGRE